ncbi:MAG: hypothetical protein R2813_03815 [Flavobacteriales bacterium]
MGACISTSRYLTLLHILLCVNLISTAADPPQRFHAGAFAGGTVPFVFSDAYYLFGANAGIYSDLRLKRQVAMRVEIAYVHNGGYIKPSKYPQWPAKMRASFRYVEVPFLLRWIPKQRKMDTELSFCFGTAYAKLISYDLKLRSGLDLKNQVEMPSNQAFMPIAGIDFIRKRIGVSLRFAQPIDLQTGLNFSARLNFEI